MRGLPDHTCDACGRTCAQQYLHKCDAVRQKGGIIVAHRRAGLVVDWVNCGTLQPCTQVNANIVAGCRAPVFRRTVAKRARWP